MEGVPDFFDAVREYEALRRELSFRQEQYNAYQSTIDKLDNMVAIESSVRSREQDEIIRFLSEEIPKAIKGKVCIKFYQSNFKLICFISIIIVIFQIQFCNKLD